MQALAVGCGAGFWGDRMGAGLPVARTLIERGGPAAMIYENLAERTQIVAAGQVFKNTFADIEFMLQAGSDNGTRFEFECYDTAHLYNLAHFLDRKLATPPLFVQTVFGILRGILEGLGLSVAAASGPASSAMNKISVFCVQPISPASLEAASEVMAAAPFG